MEPYQMWIKYGETMAKKKTIVIQRWDDSCIANEHESEKAFPSSVIVDGGCIKKRERVAMAIPLQRRGSRQKEK